jgi:hypothetical protein
MEKKEISNKLVLFLDPSIFCHGALIISNFSSFSFLSFSFSVVFSRFYSTASFSTQWFTFVRLASTMLLIQEKLLLQPVAVIPQFVSSAVTLPNRSEKKIVFFLLFFVPLSHAFWSLSNRKAKGKVWQTRAKS